MSAQQCVSIFSKIPDGYRFELFEQLSHLYDSKVFYWTDAADDRVLHLPDQEKYTFDFQVVHRAIFALIRDPHFIRSEVVFLAGYNYWWFWVLFFVSKLLGKRVVQYSDSNMSHEKTKPLFFRQLKKIVLYPLVRGSFFLYCGQQNKAYWAYYGVPDTRLIYAPYAVDTELFKPRACKKSKVFTFLFVGRLVQAKAIHTLILAFQQLSFRYPMCELQILGHGKEQGFLEELSQGLNVRFLGGKKREAIPEIMACADVFVLPSVEEPWGLVVNEAMLMGKPLILSHHVGAATDLLEDTVNGFLFEAGNVTQLANKMRWFLEHPDHLQEMGGQSLRLVQPFTLEKMVEGYKRVIDHV